MKALISQRECIDSHGTYIDVLESDYIKFFESMNVMIFPVSNFVSTIEPLFKLTEWDLLILSGGGSVPQKYYDSEFKDEPQQLYRDRIEKMLVQKCIKRKIPILAICRGMQFINGLLGGKISKLNSLTPPRPIGLDHKIWYKPWQKYIEVNNFHNDGIRYNNLAENLNVIAEDIDNQVIEGYYSEDNRILGLQWHPERQFNSQESRQNSTLIIKDFFASL